MAATTASPSHGSATSGLRLLHVALGGHVVDAGEIAAQASNAASPHVAQLVVTPAALDSTPYGQQTITPASSPATLPSGTQTATLPGGLGSVTGPTFAVTAKDGSTVLTSAVLKALGSLNIGPLPVSLDATAASLTNTAEVTSAQTSAQKSVVLGNLSLPSVGALLNALQINPEALYLSLTQANLNKLNELVGAAPLTALNAAVDGAQAAVGGAAPQSEVAAETALSVAQAAASTAATNDTAANNAFTAAVATIPTASLTALGLNSALTPAQYAALTVNKAALDLLNGSLAALATTALNADSAKATADAVVANLSDLADALFSLALNTFENVDGIDTPLASLGSIEVMTKAVASKNSPAPVAHASIGTVNILGAITPPAQLTSALNGVLAQLSGILNSVTGITFTPPSVSVGTGQTSRSVTGTTHNATAAITGVTITLPKLTLPSSFLNLGAAVRGAAPKFGSVRPAALAPALDTTVVTAGGTLQVATLSESASYTPARAASSGPGSGSNNGKTPNLAGTGSSFTLPVVAALLVMTGIGIARRRRVVTVTD